MARFKLKRTNKINGRVFQNYLETFSAKKGERSQIYLNLKDVILKFIAVTKYFHFTTENVQKLIKIGQAQMLVSLRKHL